MRKPECKQDVQRFLGMVTYLAKWIPELSDKSAPLRKLLDEKIMWKRSHEQEQSFKILKQVITSHPVLQYYDPKKSIKISSDASQDGLRVCWSLTSLCHSNGQDGLRAVILLQHDGKLREGMPKLRKSSWVSLLHVNDFISLYLEPPLMQKLIINH